MFFQLKPCHPCLIWKDHIMKTLQIKAMGPSNSVFSSSNFFGTWIFKIHQHCLQLFLKALLLTAHNNVVNSCSKSGAYHLSVPFGDLLREPGGCHTTTQEPYTLPQKGLLINENNFWLTEETPGQNRDVSEILVLMFQSVRIRQQLNFKLHNCS